MGSTIEIIAAPNAHDVPGLSTAAPVKVICRYWAAFHNGFVPVVDAFGMNHVAAVEQRWHTLPVRIVIWIGKKVKTNRTWQLPTVTGPSTCAFRARRDHKISVSNAHQSPKRTRAIFDENMCCIWVVLMYEHKHICSSDIDLKI